jgi:cob(I)alamin adenosyltransferase
VVTLNRIYTRTGDKGKTRLATGEPLAKHHPRVEAYGSVDELNAQVGVCRLHAGEDRWLEAVLARVQNELFDLGADLSTPHRDEKPDFPALRILESQVTRLEQDIDEVNTALAPLTSFVLPAGTPLAAHLHVARTVCRRAERQAVHLADTEGEIVSPEAVKYLNRLSDLLFVAARRANANGAGDVLWKPGATR